MRLALFHSLVMARLIEQHVVLDAVDGVATFIAYKSKTALEHCVVLHVHWWICRFALGLRLCINRWWSMMRFMTWV